MFLFIFSAELDDTSQDLMKKLKRQLSQEHSEMMQVNTIKIYQPINPYAAGG